MLHLGFAALYCADARLLYTPAFFFGVGHPCCIFGPFMGTYLRVVQYLIVSGFLFQAFCQQGGQVPYSTSRTRLAQVAPQAENTRKVFAQWVPGWSANTEDSSLEGNRDPEAAPQPLVDSAESSATPGANRCNYDARLVRYLPGAPLEQTAVLRQVRDAPSSICSAGQPATVEGVANAPVTTEEVAGRMDSRWQNSVSKETGIAEKEGSRWWSLWAERRQGLAFCSRQRQGQGKPVGQANCSDGARPAQTSRAGGDPQAGLDSQGGGRRRKAEQLVDTPVATGCLQGVTTAGDPGTSRQGSGTGRQGKHKAVAPLGLSARLGEARTAVPSQDEGLLPSGMELLHQPTVHLGGAADAVQGRDADGARPSRRSMAHPDGTGYKPDSAGQWCGAAHCCRVRGAHRSRDRPGGGRTGSGPCCGSGFEEAQNAGGAGAAGEVDLCCSSTGQNCCGRERAGIARKDSPTRSQDRRKRFSVGLVTDANLGWRRPCLAYGHTVRQEIDFTSVPLAQLVALGLQCEVASQTFGVVFAAKDPRLPAKTSQTHARSACWH